MGLGGAILGAAGLSAGASLIGAGIQSSAAKTASQQQLQGTQQAILAQLGMFGTANQALSPYYQAGASNIPNVRSALGTQGQALDLLGQLSNPSTAASTLQNLPGFQFQSQWGTKQAENALAAQGLGGSTGPLASAISQYNNGLAGTYYQNSVNALASYLTGAQNLTAAQQNLVNTGAGSAAALAGNATAVGQGIGQSAIAGGNAQAAGTLGSANAISGGLTGATGGLSNALLFNSILGSNSANQSGLFGNSGITDEQLNAAGGIPAANGGTG